MCNPVACRILCNYPEISSIYDPEMPSEGNSFPYAPCDYPRAAVIGCARIGLYFLLTWALLGDGLRACRRFSSGVSPVRPLNQLFHDRLRLCGGESAKKNPPTRRRPRPGDSGRDVP